MVSARLTVVPQMALISSGSSEVGTGRAERFGAEESGGMWRASELGWSRAVGGCLGVVEREEWMSPRLLRGVAVLIGLLQTASEELDWMMRKTYEGKSRGSES